MTKFNKQMIDNQNKWVALDKNQKKILETSTDLNKLYGKLKKNRIKDAVVMFVPDLSHIYSPYDSNL